ncbi:MAG TPA: prephenate dehydrogenase [Vicinamibacterales bacterium]|jgi:prephenate dehydrogenase
MSEPPFTRLAIAGAGLMGTSVGQAASGAWPGIDVRLLDAGDDLSALAEADLVILAAPVRANVALLETIEPHLRRATVVTDTGSTKRAICAAAASRPSLVFVGGHPMAGGARGGAANARADLFSGRPWILTPAPGTPTDAITRLDAFVSGLGAVPHVMTPELHDRFVGAVSHLPQLTASALMHVVGRLAGDAGLEIAGAGLLDTTRLAASPPGIWKDIGATNQDVLREALDHLIRALTEVRDTLDTGEGIDAVFTSACRWRTALDRAR